MRRRIIKEESGPESSDETVLGDGKNTTSEDGRELICASERG